MDTLVDHIKNNNWDGFEYHLKQSTLTPETALSLAEHAITHDRADMLEEILECVDFHAETVPHQQSRSYMQRKVTLAFMAMRFDKYECFAVILDCLDTMGRYECLRDCVAGNREGFLKKITPKMDPKHCWNVLEYATRGNPNILNHLLEVCPIPTTQEDEDLLSQSAPFIAETAMEVINLGWNHCLERILNLTPKEYDSTEICVVACEHENWEGARIALKFTSEEKVRAFNISFNPQLTTKNVGHFMCMLEDERLNEKLIHETSDIGAHSARRKM